MLRRFWLVPLGAWLLAAVALHSVTLDATAGRRLVVLAEGLAAAVVLVALALSVRRGSLLLALTLAGWAFTGAAVVLTAPDRALAHTFQEFVHARAGHDAVRMCALHDPPTRECVRELRWRWRSQPAARSVGDRFAVVEVSVHGDTGSATLRSGGCTLVPWQSVFHRGEDGQWRYAHGPATSGFDALCKEPGAAPPALP